MMDWPFKEPANSPVLTTRGVLLEGRPILVAVHEETWRFQDREEWRPEEMMSVSLYSIAQMDPSLCGLRDLPRGGRARRESAGAPWRTE